MSAIGFIGGGNMATAIIEGLGRDYDPSDLVICDLDPEVCRRHAAAGRRVTGRSADLGAADILVLAVKPQVLPSVANDLAGLVTPAHLLVSILAGITTDRLAAVVGTDARIVRAMPNTPMAIGQGMVGICCGGGAGAEELKIASSLFAGAAEVLPVPEERMDALTAISGSGPAYLFYLAEALHTAAVQQGFAGDEAALLVGRTLSGSIAYLLGEQGFPAAELRRRVTSPGGTTAAAIGVFEDHDLQHVVAEAVAAAVARSRELASADGTGR